MVQAWHTAEEPPALKKPGLHFLHEVSAVTEHATTSSPAWHDREWHELHTGPPPVTLHIPLPQGWPWLHATKEPLESAILL